MPEVTVPAALVVATDDWAQPDVRVFQRGEFTSASRETILGPAARWRCEANIVPGDDATLTGMLGFLAAIGKPGNWCRLRPRGPMAQVTGGGRPTAGTVNGAGQAGYTLSIAGLAAGVTNLVAGHMITVTLPGDDAQLLVLDADLVANGSGIGVASFNQPLRRSPAAGAAVELSLPFARMRCINPMALQNDLHLIRRLPPLQFEEAF